MKSSHFSQFFSGWITIQTPIRYPIAMARCMNKKQISCLVAGLCFTGALIAVCIWASLGGIFDKPKSTTHSLKNETVSPMSIVDRRGFIFSRSAEHPESVRIIASIATSKPVAVNPNNLTLSQRPRLAKNRHSDTTMATLASSKAELNYKVRQQQFPTTTQRSFFDLPDANTWRPALVQQSRTNGDFNRPLNQWRFQQPLGGQQFDQEDAFNMTKLLTTVSRIFGVNLAEEDPHLYANRDAISADRSSWVTLSYLSLSLFLLRQMDHLLKLQSEPLDPVLMQQRGRSFNNYQSNPWTNNSLNLLFIEPGVNTDVERVVNNEENVEQPNGYLWAAHNILKASKDSDRIDCLWSAYCFELDNRATLDGLAGKVARVNGIVLKMVTGWLSPPAAMIKLLRSSFNWDGINCNRLFPSCKQDDAVSYLIRLATNPVSN